MSTTPDAVHVELRRGDRQVIATVRPPTELEHVELSLEIADEAQRLGLTQEQAEAAAFFDVSVLEGLSRLERLRVFAAQQRAMRRWVRRVLIALDGRAPTEDDLRALSDAEVRQLCVAAVQAARLGDEPGEPPGGSSQASQSPPEDDTIRKRG